MAASALQSASGANTSPVTVMTYDNAAFIFAQPRDILLEVSPSQQTQAWQVSQSNYSPTSRYQAYLNQLCRDAVLPWLREDFDVCSPPFPHTAVLASIWEFVNGFALNVAGKRFILIPSEVMDASELRVPQEWVDIPSWAGDYYLGVQIHLEDGYVRVWGYSTHARLKTSGSYDAGDRTYTAYSSDIIDDMSVLAVAQQLCPQERTRESILQIPILPQTQAENLISRLGNQEAIAPRLAIGFPLWAALMEHGGWRKRLYQRRLGLSEQWSIIAWLQNGVSQLAQQFNWESINLQTSFAGAKSVEETPSQKILSKHLVIAGQTYELRVIPQGDNESRTWRFELQNAAVGAVIPGGFKLRLLTEDLQPFENNEDVATTAVEQLFVEVALTPNEGIVWEIEPLPEGYDREILRF